MRQHTLGRANRKKVSQAMSGASAPPKLPPLPDLATLARLLRLSNRYCDGPATFALYCHMAGSPEVEWVIGVPCDWPHADHVEGLPGDDKPFDAVAAARRLLAEARLAGFR
jgi:hypothetical protein